MPSRYYKIVGTEVGAREVDLFFIDTSPMVHQYRTKVHSKIAENVASQDVAQLAWLDGELAKSATPWKLVFGRHTIYSGGSEHGNTVELVEQVAPILERGGFGGPADRTDRRHAVRIFALGLRGRQGRARRDRP